MTDYVVSSGVTSSGLTVSAVEELYVYGTVIDTVVDNDGGVTVENGGAAIQTTLGTTSGYSSELLVSSGGITSLTAIGVGAQEYVYGGKALSTKVDADGNQIVASGGKAFNAVLSGARFEQYGTDYQGASQEILYGGTASNTQIEYLGGQTVYSGGVSYSANIVSGGIELVYDGAESISATINNGGSQTVSGGSATTTMVYSGGRQVVEADSYNSSGTTEYDYIGNAIGTTLSGGTETISSGGIATGTDIFSGGSQTILGGGSATGTQIYHGAETISSGAIARGTVIYAGGQVIVSSGGLLVNSPIGSKGEVTVQSGGVVSAAKIAGGTLDLAGGKAVGPITFSNTGGKLLAADTVPASIISGFAAGDEIVLGSITYKAGATVTVKSAGVVTITDNNKAYNLKIAGAVVGETDFKFSSGSVLTKLASPAMEFLRPAANPDAPMMDAVMVGAGREMFGVYDVPAVLHGGYMAHEGWRPVFYGVPMSLGLHPQ